MYSVSILITATAMENKNMKTSCMNYKQELENGSKIDSQVIVSIRYISAN
jgi:hypothetical protein